MVRGLARMFGLLVIVMGLGYQFPASGAAAPTLEEMKDLFTTLIDERAGLSARMKASQKTLVTARSTRPNGGFGYETATAYCRELQRLEGALDVHPKFVAYQEQYDAFQADKVEVSREQSEILRAWRDAKKARIAKFDAKVNVLTERFKQERDAVFQSAGVKNAEAFKASDRRKMREIYVRFTNDVAVVKNTSGPQVSKDATREARVKDGSASLFNSLSEKYQEFEARQKAIEATMVRVRQSLRDDDPEIAKLQKSVREASQKHLLLVDAQPQVIEARAFIRNVIKIRSDIDRKLRVLRNAILTADTDYKSELDRQIVAGGLGLVADDFWKL